MRNKIVLLAVLLGFYLAHLLLLFSNQNFNVWFLSYGKTELPKYVELLLPNWTAIARYGWMAWTGWIVLCLAGTPVLSISVLLELLGAS